jgi:serine acetyltransferase
VTADVLAIAYKNALSKKNNHINAFSVILLILKYLFISRGYREVILFRIGHACRNILPLKVILFILQNWFSSVEIPFSIEIGPGFALPHPYDIVFTYTSKLGARVSVYQGVTIGNNFGKNIKGRVGAIIGDDVTLSAGVKIIGPITIGDKVIIGANSVVTSDIPSNSIVAGIPARVIGSYTESILPSLKALADSMSMSE